jgi:hypothetical protein
MNGRKSDLLFRCSDKSSTLFKPSRTALSTNELDQLFLYVLWKQPDLFFAQLF